MAQQVEVGACCQAGCLESYSQSTHGGKKGETPEACLLTDTQVPCMACKQIYTPHTKIGRQTDRSVKKKYFLKKRRKKTVSVVLIGMTLPHDSALFTSFQEKDLSMNLSNHISQPWYSLGSCSTDSQPQ